MSQAASQASKFYRDVSVTHKLWTIRKGEVYATLINPEGRIVVPFWSSLSRVKRIIKMVEVYADSEPFEVIWDNFKKLWVPDLNEKGWLVGVNWSGKKAIGYDMEPDLVVRAIEGKSR